jgi:hypothetical protein
VIITICYKQSVAGDLFDNIATSFKLVKFVAIGLQELFNLAWLSDEQRFSIEGSKVAYQA